MAPPIPGAGQEWHDEVLDRRFILQSDISEDLAFDLNSYSWITIRTWEFDPRCRARYLVDVEFFKRELLNALTDDDEDCDEDFDNDEEAMTTKTRASTTTTLCGIQSTIRQISSRTRSSSSPLTRTRLTTSLSETTSASGFTSRRWRRGRR
jgi:hypothetical protein